MMLEGRIAFLTGAGSGIGRAGALALGREGALVVVTDINARTAEEVADDIRNAGGRAEAWELDVLSDAGLRLAIDKCVDRHGRIDILHSHAGIQIPGSLEDIDAKDMDASWALNVRSHYVAARAAVPHMKLQGKGSIIITSSNSGVQYDRGMIAYATTKHAVIAMTRQMAADYARFNIRFNALCPGFVDTSFNAGFEAQMGGRPGLESYVRDSIPIGRWGSVEEVAEGIVYLASDRSSFMTGHALVIDGGECL